MDDLAGDGEGTHPAGAERLGADGPTWARDPDPSEIGDPFLAGELGADLDEELGLQLGEPRAPAAHRAGEIVLGEPIRRDDVRILRVTHRRERVVGILPVLEDGAALLLVERKIGRASCRGKGWVWG